MYAQASIYKIITFFLFMLVLGGGLFLTLRAKTGLPAEYFSINGLVRIGALPVKSFFNRIYYSWKEEDTVLAAAAIQAFGISDKTYQKGGNAREVPALVYHGISNQADRFTMTLNTFKDQMFALKNAGYETITLSEFIAFIEGRGTVPARSFLLTFDDGRSDSYFEADPVLAALGYNAVMFVATDKSIERPNVLNSYYLQGGLLKKMLASGRWEIGSHAIQDTGGFVPIGPGNDEPGSTPMGNFLSNRQWLEDKKRLENDEEYEARLLRELVSSKDALENALGTKITAFSYPFGDFGNQAENNQGAIKTLNKIVSSTYKAAFRQIWPNDNLFTSNYPGADFSYLHRVEPATDWSGEYLIGLLKKTEGKPIPFNDSFTEDTGWKKNWGDVKVENDSLDLQATAETTGAFTFVDGTLDWQDYIYAASVDWQNGSHVSLLARLQNKDNYVSCIFSKDVVEIEGKKDGVPYSITKARNSIALPISEETSLGMSVAGSNIRCYEGSRVAAYAFEVGGVPKSGGIGFQIWDREPGVATISIKELELKSADEAESFKESLPAYPIIPAAAKNESVEYEKAEYENAEEQDEKQKDFEQQDEEEQDFEQQEQKNEKPERNNNMDEWRYRFNPFNIFRRLDR